MIQLSASSEIVVAISPQDFRKGIDGFVSVCRHDFGHNPKTGTIFVFINRSKTMVRLLSYENNGYWLMTKRLSKGKFTTWPKDKKTMTPLQAWQLRKLLCSPSLEK
jgi:hypothetical protein